jgi:hypothetical protein
MNWVVFFFYFLLTIIFLEAIAIIWLIWLKFKINFLDMVIFFDSSGRWTRKFLKISSEVLHFRGKDYFVTDKSAKLSIFGKKLLLYTENKPQPLILKSNMQEWVSSEAVQGIINNEHLKLITTPKNTARDIMIIIGMVAACVAAVAGIIVALKLFGVIK